MKAVIVLAHSKIGKRQLLDRLGKETLLVGVDAGCNLLYDFDLVPDLAVGDFDSIGPHILDSCKEAGADIVSHPVEKDMTDGELAILEALGRGCTEIEICGTEFSGETDHFLANILLLNKYPMCSIATRNEEIRLASAGTILIERDRGEYISFLPLDKTEVSLRGFQYDGYFLVDLGDTTTLRNKVVAEKARIILKMGKILIIQRK